jgi:hypothetical protein
MTARLVNHLAIECPYHNRISALADVLFATVEMQKQSFLHQQSKKHI